MNISDPIPVSGSSGSVGGSNAAWEGNGSATSPSYLGDTGRQRSNHALAGASGPTSSHRIDSGLAAAGAATSAAPQLHSANSHPAAGQQYGVSSPMSMTSPLLEGNHAYSQSSSSLNMAGLALDTQPPHHQPHDYQYPQQQQHQPQQQAQQGSSQQIVPVAFEEGTLRALCDLDCGFPLLMDRIKQSMASCRETSVFFKKRAQIEEDYARSLQKLTRERIESYSLSDGKGGSFVTAYNALLRSHDILAENHVKLSSQLSEMSEQLIEMAREVEKSRKSAKELGTRLEKNLTESESSTDKARGRFDTSVEDLERILISKAGENARDASNLPSESGSLNNSSGKRTLGKAIGKLKGGPKNPAQLQRMEEDARYKMNSLSDGYRHQVLSTQTIRQEYFNLQLPRMLKSMKESLDEIDLGTQFHLSRYAYLYENVLVNDGLTVAPAAELGVTAGEVPGLKAIAESIDNREDFKKFMQNYAVSFASSGQRVLRRQGPPEEGFVRAPKVPAANGGTASGSAYNAHASGAPQATMSQAQSSGQLADQQQGHQQPGQHFGADLAMQMERDGVDVPKVLQKCVETIEQYGLTSQGIYRLSGTTSRIQRLKAKMERDIDSVNLNSDENLMDINDISGVLKLFFRELPDPIFTHELYPYFIEAARIENSRLRHIRLHERINDLPDANYATCKYFLGHLDKVRQHGDQNSMTIKNLAIVFGPTLLRPQSEDTVSSIQDMAWQCKAIETIIEHYAEIFIEAEEDSEAQQQADGQTSKLDQDQGAGLSVSPTSASLSNNMI